MAIASGKLPLPMQKIEKFEEKRATVLKTKQLKDGENFVVKWENDNLKLFIWDANEEDGDRIRLKINDEIILYDYTTKRKRKK